MELKSEFADFLTEIRPTVNQRGEMKTAHATLRKRLLADEKLGPIIHWNFLQGSYKRSTAVRPKAGKRSDVDIIIVTKLSEAEYTPEEGMALFEPFLDDYYEGKWRKQGRSFGIDMSEVSLDLVITSAPLHAEIGVYKSDAVASDDDIEEARDWRLNEDWLALDNRARMDSRDIIRKALQAPEWTLHPLRIPDREAQKWDDTHPLAQIQQTRTRNAATNFHFVNVVKAVKWLRLERYPDTKHPKGFPVERMVGDCCPDGTDSVAEGVVLTLEKIVSKYAGGKPRLPDYGVPGHDVLGRLSDADFATFYNQIKECSPIARRALDSIDREESSEAWRELFGSKFPKCEGGSGGGSGGGGTKKGFQEPTKPATPGTGRFARFS
jgi:hypothetical protein